MADKIFYVTRTEDKQTHTAGAATLNRADEPQLVKVYDSPEDIVLSSISTGEIFATKGTDFEAVSIVDRVAADNMNPVTSNAVADAIDTAESYSTTETLTGGTWIDGKPIYRKVVDTGTLPNNNTKTVSHGISNLGKLINQYGYATNGTTIFTLPHVSDDINYVISIYCDATLIHISTNTNITDYTESYIILEYTKTTD